MQRYLAPTRPSDASDLPALRPAVIAGPERLSSKARAQIQALSGARPHRFHLELALNWLVIAVLVALGVKANYWPVTVLCIILIATRQMVLGLLLHEQVHRLGARSKYADWFVNIVAVYPLFVTTVEDYAKVHLSHHKYFMTPRDPDFIRKSGHDWTFPTSLKTAFGIVLKDITGLNTIALIRGKTAPPNIKEFERRNPSPRYLRLTFLVALASALTLVDGWSVFLLYWVVPLLTFTQLFVRWVAVTEHKYNMENASVYEITPLIELTWWQKIFIPDLNFAMHVYHHLHPGVSFANLPKVHAIYKAEGLVDESAIFHGQGAFLRYLIGPEKRKRPT